MKFTFVCRTLRYGRGMLAPRRVRIFSKLFCMWSQVSRDNWKSAWLMSSAVNLNTLDTPRSVTFVNNQSLFDEDHVSGDIHDMISYIWRVSGNAALFEAECTKSLRTIMSPTRTRFWTCSSDEIRICRMTHENHILRYLSRIINLAASKLIWIAEWKRSHYCWFLIVSKKVTAEQSTAVSIRSPDTVNVDDLRWHLLAGICGPD